MQPENEIFYILRLKNTRNYQTIIDSWKSNLSSMYPVA